MSAALLRLLLMSIRGRIVRLARMLRQPKYLIGSLLGTAWFLFWTGYLIRGGELRAWIFSDVHSRLSGESGSLIQLLLALLIAVWFSVEWLVPRARIGLPFKEPDLHLLLPAPVTRRRLIQYGLLKAQGPILFTTLILGVALGSGEGIGFAGLVLALWLFLTTWDLHGRWRALVVLRTRTLVPRSARRVRLGIVLTVTLFWVVLFPAVRRMALAIRERLLVLREADRALDPVALLDSLGEVPHPPVVRVLLRPFLWLTDPLFASGGPGFLVALIPASAIALLLYESVLRSRAPFEESSLAHARHQATRKSPTRRYLRMSDRARRRNPFRLAPLGRPVFAVIWKNLQQIVRWPLALCLLALLLVAVGLGPALALTGAPAWVFGVLFGLGAWCALFLPFGTTLGLRNDLRSELKHLELVRTWPVSGRSLLLGQSIAPATCGALFGLAGLVLVGTAVLGQMLRGVPGGKHSFFMVSWGAGGTALGASAEMLLWLAGLVPPIAAIALLTACLQNLLTVKFPAWASLDPRTAGGMASLGQNLLLATALGLALLLLAVPSGVLVVLIVLLRATGELSWLAYAAPVWGALVALPMFFEAGFLVYLSGRAWERLDPSLEILES